MYDNRLTSCLYKYSLPSQAFINPGKLSDPVGSVPQLTLDTSGMLHRDERVAVMPTSCGVIRVSPQALTITPPRPVSPTSSEPDSECLDDESISPSSFAGEECPDFCGGPKNSCRSWTPPASPFYYTHAGGIFLLDDRHKFEERQQIELKHTLHDLDLRLQRLRESMSPPRFLSQLDELENSTPLSPSGKAEEPRESLPPLPTEGLSELSRITTISPESCSCGFDDCLRQRKLCRIDNHSANSSQRMMDLQKKAETRTTDLGKLIHTSLQHVQSTNSPPRYLANVPEMEAQYLPKEPIIIPSSYEKLRDETWSRRQISPQLHLGNSAYPSPLPSSPETRPRRKRGRNADEGLQESSGRKRRYEEDDEWVSTHWSLRSACS